MNTFISELIWLRPLWLFALLPLWVLLYWRWRQLRTESDWQHVVEPALLEHVVGGQSGSAAWGSAKISLLLLGLAWTAGVVAAAGPSWQREPLPVHRIDGARVVVLDLSESMLATDVAPDRMTRTRFKLRELLRQSPEGETALVVFAGDAHVVMPLTDDTNTIDSQVAVLEPSLLPVRGDRLAVALQKADELLRNGAAGHSHIIVLTDGFADVNAAVPVAKRLRRQGHQLTVWGIGTEKGAPIPVRGGFVRNADGAITVARLDPGPLRRLADVGGGALVAATADDQDLGQLLHQIDPQRQANLDERDAGRVASSQPLDGGIWLMPFVLLMFLLRFRRGWLPVLVLSVSATSVPEPVLAVDWWSRADQKAARSLAEGGQAPADVFNEPGWQGTAQYRSGEYEAALDSFEVAGDGADQWYNRGNTLARLGRYRDAIAAYDAALERRPDLPDAKFNRDLIQRLLQQQSQSQPQDQESGDQTGQESNLSEGSSGGAGAESSGGGDMQTGGHQQQDDGETSTDAAAEQPREAQQSDTAAGEQPAQAGQIDQADNPEQAPPAPGDEVTAGDVSADGDHELKQKLQQLPEDPGGLLREKFRRQALRRQRTGVGLP